VTLLEVLRNLQITVNRTQEAEGPGTHPRRVMTSVLLPACTPDRNLNLPMKTKSIFGAGFVLLLMTLSASAGSVLLNVSSYSFQLDGGGGGATATLNGAPAEIFCDDFANSIYVSSSNQANVTTLGTGADLDDTRFGNVSPTSWTAITSLGVSDDAFFNTGSGSTGLARYEIAAYLVSLYNRSLGNNTSNNQIQEAIWTLMDPTAEGAVIDPSGVNPSTYLEQAETWYSTMNANQVALNSFLSQFEIVSAANMTFSNGLGIGGFQEQIVMTPEPRGVAWMLLVLLVGGLLVMRGRAVRAAKRYDVQCL